MTIRIWSIHYTKDDTPFYYNLITNQSQWDKPNDYDVELDPQTKVQNYSGDKPTKIQSIQNSDYVLVLTKQNFQFYFNSITKESFWDKPNDLIKLKEEINEEINDNNEVIEMNEDDIEYQLQLMNEMIQEQNEMEDQHVEDIPEELKILNFQNLLNEINVSAIDLWEDTLPKIQHDSRYIMMNNPKECKNLFIKYCKELSYQVKDVPSKPKTDEEYFNKVLIKYVKTSTKWEDFNKKISVNPKAIKLPYKQRQKLFNDYLNNLKNNNDDSNKEKEKLNKKLIEKQFTELLKSIKVRSDDTWEKIESKIKDDPSYQKIESPERCEVLFLKYRSSLTG